MPNCERTILMTSINVSTPSRLCLFGEHQDYLGLEVIAVAVNLRFKAKVTPRDDRSLHILINSDIFSMNSDERAAIKATELWIDLDQPIAYSHNRDYLKSSVNTLLNNGWFPKTGYDVEMLSEIPIGKGMSSSTTMILALIKALLESENAALKDDKSAIAMLGFEAEVAEFNEPGGKMDHLTSAYGGLVHLDFGGAELLIEPLATPLSGTFILFDSLEEKDTTTVLKNARDPVLEGLALIKAFGISHLREFDQHPNRIDILNSLPEMVRLKLQTQINNDKLRAKALSLLTSNTFDDIRFGALLTEHHHQLRDGLGISTPKIETILTTALQNGAYGGKINGSGGGGCCFVYAPKALSEQILEAVAVQGFPGICLSMDTGVRRD